MSHKESKVRFDKLIKLPLQFMKSQPHKYLIIILFKPIKQRIRIIMDPPSDEVPKLDSS